MERGNCRAKPPLFYKRTALPMQNQVNPGVDEAPTPLLMGKLGRVATGH